MYRNPAVNPLVIVLAKAALVLTALSVAGQVLKFALVKRTPGEDSKGLMEVGRLF